MRTIKHAGLLLHRILIENFFSLGLAAVILFVGLGTFFLARTDEAFLRAGGSLEVEESAWLVGGEDTEKRNDVGHDQLRVNEFSAAVVSPVFLSRRNAGSREEEAGSPAFLGQGGGREPELLGVESSSFRAFASPLTNLASLNERSEVTTYVVQEGDTISGIAAEFGISAGSIIWSNNLRNADYLRPGQQLVILPVSGVLHKVKQGETLVAIVKRYKGDLEKTLDANDIPLDGTIIAGQEIVIVDGAPPIPISPARPRAPRYASSTVSAGYFIYPTTGRNWGRVHANNGVDVANSCGTPIYAAAAGSVILSDGVGWNGGFGKFIKIKHPNGVVTLYAHNSQNLVAAGEEVGQGQLIAYIGNTGRSTGCHVHFEVHGARNPLAR